MMVLSGFGGRFTGGRLAGNYGTLGQGTYQPPPGTNPPPPTTVPGIPGLPGTVPTPPPIESPWYFTWWGMSLIGIGAFAGYKLLTKKKTTKIA